MMAGLTGMQGKLPGQTSRMDDVLADCNGDVRQHPRLGKLKAGDMVQLRWNGYEPVRMDLMNTWVEVVKLNKRRIVVIENPLRRHETLAVRANQIKGIRPKDGV